jgi:hypothetical protein
MFGGSLHCRVWVPYAATGDRTAVGLTVGTG